MDYDGYITVEKCRWVVFSVTQRVACLSLRAAYTFLVVTTWIFFLKTRQTALQWRCWSTGLMIYTKGQTSRWVHFRGIQDKHANYSDQHANDKAQHNDYSEQHTTSKYSEQHAEYSEQYVNFPEQHALWLLYKISSSAACSFGVWTLEIAHQPHHGLIFSLPSGELSW